MSRTYRRKNYEDTLGGSWDRIGRRRYGFGAIQQIWGINRFGWYWTDVRIREATNEELITDWLRWHGESSHNCAWSPCKDHRKRRMRENRRINREELHKWIRCEDYEPLFEADPRNCWWDWD